MQATGFVAADIRPLLGLRMNTALLAEITLSDHPDSGKIGTEDRHYFISYEFLFFAEIQFIAEAFFKEAFFEET